MESKGETTLEASRHTDPAADDLETPTDDLETPTDDLETPTDDLETLAFDLETPTFELETLGQADDYHRSDGHQLWLAGLAWQRELAQVLRTSGLTPTQYLVLEATSVLAGQVGGLSQGQIATASGIHRMTVHRVLKTLEDEGFVDRSALNKSAWDIGCTRKGEAIVAHYQPLIRQISGWFFAKLPDRAAAMQAIGVLVPNASTRPRER